MVQLYHSENIYSNSLLFKVSYTRSLKSLFKTIINRYLRFAVPLLFVNSLIYCVGKTIGFSATECGSLMGNNWFASQYLLDLHFEMSFLVRFYLIKHLIQLFGLLDICLLHQH